MEIVNIVVSGSFNQKVDLQALMALGDVYSYDPEMYHGGYIRLSSAKVTVYRSGKYIIPGIKSQDRERARFPSGSSWRCRHPSAAGKRR